MPINTTKPQAKKRIEKLKKAINYHRYLYHVLDKQEISDEALDSLKKELFDLEQQYPEFITQDSPTQRVGGKPLREFKKVQHETSMLSFNDAFSEEDMKAWLKRLENYLHYSILKPKTPASPACLPAGRQNPKPNFYCELKIDGLAIELIYENGILVQGSTRGDGLIGEDITQNLKTIEAIPLKLLKPKTPALPAGRYNLKPKIIVRGEVFITKKEFERINKEQLKKGLKIFANPRNIAAGSVRQLNPKITASRKLDSFQYDIVTDIGQNFHEEEHLLLKSLGFKTNPHNKPANSLEEVFEFRNYWEKNRDKIPYEIDGIVVIVNDNKIFEAGGVIGKAPRAAIAYKFFPKETETVIEDIKVQVGRTGALTPVAVLKPVQVGGITITHSTLHNYDEIKRLEIKIGDTVVVSRAGDVIPQVNKVLKEMRTGKEKEFKMPKVCPVDGSKVVQDGVIYRCSNPKCGARHRESLRHFVSRKAFSIEGLGPKIIDRFLDEGLISDAADIFELKEGDIAVLERFGEKSAENIVGEITARKKIALERFIYALGILHVGEETAQLLAQQVIAKIKNPCLAGRQEKSKIKINEVLKIFQNLSLEELQKIPDIGPKVSQSIYDWFHNKRNIKFLEKLEKVGVEIETPKLKAKSQKLKARVFVLTGVLASMSREEAKEKIRELGGDISEPVGKKTDYVVAGENPGSKYERAKQLNIKIINEREFLDMLE